MTTTSSMPALPLRQIFGSAVGAAVFGGLVPLLMIATLFR